MFWFLNVYILQESETVMHSWIGCSLSHALCPHHYHCQNNRHWCPDLYQSCRISHPNSTQSVSSVPHTTPDNFNNLCWYIICKWSLCALNIVPWFIYNNEPFRQALNTFNTGSVGSLNLARLSVIRNIAQSINEFLLWQIMFWYSQYSQSHFL